MKVNGFNWDQGNLKKCEKHGLNRKMIEDFFNSSIWVAPDMKHSSQEERFFAIGICIENQKPMIVVFTYRFLKTKKLIRPISARYMHKREAKKYEQGFTKN